MGVPLQVVWETLMPNHSNDIRTKVNTIFLEKLIGNIHAGKGALYPNVEEVLDYMKIKRLTPLDAEAYLAKRLKALQNNPEAFGSSYEEERDQPVEKYILSFNPMIPLL